MFEIFRNIFFKEKKIDKNLETNVRYLVIYNNPIYKF